MLDLDAPSLIPDSGKRHSISPESDAKARALAVETGAKWKCARVNAWVDVTDCLARYATAQNARPAHSPCLECSSIAAHVRKIGGIPEPQPQQKEPAMPVAAKKLEVVQSGKNPFAEWEAYSPRDRYTVGLESFASISTTAISFSAGATKQLGLDKIETISLFHNGQKIGLALHQDSSGKLKCTKDVAGRIGSKVAASGLIKAMGITYDQRNGMRYPIREVAPGFVEIDLGHGWRA